MQVVPLPWDTPFSSTPGFLQLVWVQVNASDSGICLSEFFSGYPPRTESIGTDISTLWPSCNTARMYARAVHVG